MNKDRSLISFISVSEARKQWADIVNKVHYKGEVFVLQKHDKNVAALVPFEDFDITTIGEKVTIVDSEKSQEDLSWEEELKKKLGF